MWAAYDLDGQLKHKGKVLKTFMPDVVSLNKTYSTIPLLGKTSHVRRSL
jgi:hypothetical protein